MNENVEKAIVTNDDEVKNNDNGIFVCGVCQVGFNCMKEITEHITSRSCTKKNIYENIGEDKPHVLGFLLWKNSQTENIAVSEKKEVLNLWKELHEDVKKDWIKAGGIAHGCFKFTNIISKLTKPTDELTSGRKLVLEKIVTHHFNEKTKKFMFLIKWKNYPPEQNTWESEETVFATDHFHQYQGLFENGILPTNMLEYALKNKQNQNIGVSKLKMSPQANVQNEIVRQNSSRKRNHMDAMNDMDEMDAINDMDAVDDTDAMNRVSEWCKQNELFKRKHGVLEDIIVKKKKYFNQFPVKKYLNDPIVHKSANALIIENDKACINNGKIVRKDQLTMEEQIKFNVLSSASKTPLLNCKQWSFAQQHKEKIEKLMKHLELFIKVHSDSDSSLLKTSPLFSEVILTVGNMTLKVTTINAPQPAIYKFSDTDGLVRLSDETWMMIKHDKPKKGLAVCVDKVPPLQSSKKTLDISEARKLVLQSSPLIKSFTNKKSLVKNTKIQATIKSSPFKEDTAAEPKFKNDPLLQVQAESSKIKSNINKAKFVPAQGQYISKLTTEQKILLAKTRQAAQKAARKTARKAARIAARKVALKVAQKVSQNRLQQKQLNHQFLRQQAVLSDELTSDESTSDESTSDESTSDESTSDE